VSELASFHVAGRPRPKGSMKVISRRGARPVMGEDNPFSGPWRHRMAEAIRAQCVYSEPCTRAVQVHATFYFERVGPTAQLLSWPIIRAGANANADIDKLLRNLHDAMEDSKLIENDCQIVSVHTSKRWATDGQLPGVDVGVYVMEDEA
jgi:Holliday junction resolvase RusA-like endonuclease